MTMFKRISYVYVFFVAIMFIGTLAYCAKEQSVKVAAELPVRSFEQVNADLDRLLVFLADAASDQNAGKTLAQKMSSINKIEFQDFRAEILGVDAQADTKGINVLTLVILKNCIENQLRQSLMKIKEVADKFSVERDATEQELQEIALVRSIITKSDELVEYSKKLFPFAFSTIGKVVAAISPKWLRDRAFGKFIPMALITDPQGGDYQINKVDGTLEDAEAIQPITDKAKEDTGRCVAQIDKNATNALKVTSK